MISTTRVPTTGSTGSLLAAGIDPPRRIGRRLLASIAAATATALGVAFSVASPAAAAVATAAPSVRGVPAYDHIVVVVEENHAPVQVASQPFLSSLIAGGANFTNAHAATHPSQPNYLHLWAGQTYGVNDNRCTSLSGDNLGAQALAAGLTVKGYAEGLPAAGSTACTAGAYVKKHNPIATFTQTAGPSTNLPMTAFPGDFHNLPRLAFVVPNQDHDMHDGSVKAGDDWLRQRLGGYAQWAKANNSLLLVTFDEDDGSKGNSILNVLYGAHVKPGTYAEPVTHHSDLATIEASLGLPALTSAPPITSAFDTAGTGGAAGGAGGAVGGVGAGGGAGGGAVGGVGAGTGAGGGAGVGTGAGGGAGAGAGGQVGRSDRGGASSHAGPGGGARSSDHSRTSGRAAPSGRAGTDGDTDDPTTLPTPAPSVGTVPTYDHIVVVVEENHAPDQVASQPFLSSLIAGGATFPNAHAETYPSQPNYLHLWAGQTYGVDNNRCTSLSGDNLGAQVLAAGLTVKGYAEGLPHAGSTACRAGAYVKKHNPIATFTQTAGPSTNLPMTAFPEDYTDLPHLALVVPNLKHDMHDGSVKAGDDWLQEQLGGYAEWAKSNNSLLLVTFDEDDHSNENGILNLLYGAHVKPGTYADPVTHHSDLATIEASLGLPALTTTPPITTAFDTSGPVCEPETSSDTDDPAALPAATASAIEGAAAPPALPTRTSSASEHAVARDGKATSLTAALAAGGDLAEGTYSIADFRAGTNGAVLPPTGLTGAGVDRTVVQMSPHTSSKGRSVPTRPYTTNQLSLLKVNGSPQLSGFTLQGTDQGHLYNGLRVERATDARITDVKVAAVPGNRSFPPGETFGINDYRTTGSVYCGLEIDGAGVGAAGFGANNATNLTIRNAISHGNPNGSGFTFWQSSDINLIDVTSTDNHGGLNFERDSGTINIVRPVLSALKNGHQLSFNSDIAGAKVTITDPVLQPGEKLRILVVPKYLGKPNQQKKSDIHVIIGGVDRTQEVVQWVG